MFPETRPNAVEASGESVIRLLIISSWPTDVIGGSGTAMFFNSFLGGLRGRDYEVEVIAPEFDITDYVTATLQRFLFNTELRTDPRVQRADVLIGLDYDGYGLDPATRPPMITSAHAVYGDVVRWEEEPYRTMVQAQAFFDRVAMQRTDIITTASAYAKARVVELYGIAPEKILVVPHGQETPAWVPLVEAEPRQPNDHPIILCVGKMYPRKRVDILLHAAALLRTNHPTLELRIVGDGLSWNRLQQITDELDLRSQVTFLGHLRDDRAFAREWRQADIFCHPSSQETFGYVYLEAMRIGKPVVAVRAGAAPEVLGATALLAEPENPAALAAALDTMLSDPNVRARSGAAGRVRAQLFTMDRMLDGYDEAILRVLHLRQKVNMVHPARLR